MASAVRDDGTEIGFAPRSCKFPVAEFEELEQSAFSTTELDATSAKLGSDDGYSAVDGSRLVVPLGTLCQVGRHLAPEVDGMSGVFCQIVSGPSRGGRFGFSAEDFQVRADSSSPSRGGALQHRVRPNRR